MKPWNTVTERERGWIEGLLSSGRQKGRRGGFKNGTLQISLGSDRNIPERLCNLIGGSIREDLKKHAYTQLIDEGPKAGTKYEFDAGYSYVWYATGGDAAEAMSRLAELELPFNLRSIVNTQIKAIDVAA